MTQVICCKCSAKYDLRLFEAVGIRLPVTQCPNCGVVHSLKFDTVDAAPTKRIESVKLLSYYYGDVSPDGSGNEGAIGSNANPPAKLGVAISDWVKTNKFWVGVALNEEGCNKTVDTSQNITLYWRKDGGGWTLLSSSGELKYAGTGQMAYTDLTPPNGNAWVGQNAGCGSGLEPSIDMVAQDNSGTLATGTGTGNYTKEFWWAVDPSGATDGSLYEFALRDAQGLIGGAGTEYLLDCSVTIYEEEAIVKTVTDKGAGQDTFSGLSASTQTTDQGRGQDILSGLAAAIGAILDAGAGQDSISITELIVKTLTDAGIGADVLAGLAASLQVIDQGAGQDSASLVEVRIGITDAATGADVTAIQVSIQTTDVGIGLDLASTMLQLAVTDAGAGQDSLAGLSVETQIEDDGIGIDSVSGLSVDVQVTDDGVGIDSVSLALTISVSDAATGIDSVSVAATIIITVLDALVGIDSFAGLSASTQMQDSSAVQDVLAGLAAGIAISDLGVGTDSVTKSVAAIIKMVTDLGVGTDVLAGLATSLQVEDAGTAVDELRGLAASLLAAEDVGVGIDLVSIISYILKTISDTAVGYDVLAGLAKQLAVEDSSGVIDFLAGLAVSLQITDSSEVADTIARSVLASILDYAVGVDSFGGISVEAQTQDRGTGISSVSGISVSLQVTDFFAASDIASVLALIVKTVTDSGAGIDSLAGVTFNISVEDAVQGADLIYQLQVALSVMDLGVGIEALLLEKQVEIAFVGITIISEVASRVKIIQKTASRTTSITRTSDRTKQIYCKATRIWS